MATNYEIYKNTMKLYLGEEADEFLEWLDTTNASVSPASIKHGLNKEGGWAEHCNAVLSKIIKIAKAEADGDEEAFNKMFSKKSLVKVAYLHDLYKINRYEKYLRNVKDSNGQWVQVEEYKVSDNFEQHINNALTSIIIANRFFKLTDEEIEAIYCAYPSDSGKPTDEYNVCHLADITRFAVKSVLAEEKDR